MSGFFVLRLGHRPLRDKRISTHVCLVARVMGAEGVYIAGLRDDSLRLSIERTVTTWGGPFWIEFVANPLRLLKEFKSKGGKVVHLTMYGMPLSEAINELPASAQDILVVVGGEKVPPEYYREADLNVSVGSQPHSEVAALALFFDRITHGNWEKKVFKDARVQIIPSKKGKNVLQLH